MSSDDQSDKECPLCMEAFDIDDINFYPCNCQYQICRFCWHRIRTNENGLCPACRQSYPEDPVNFQPLSSAELQKIKSEKKQKVQQQKNKVVDGRKHLAEFRVLQKNLVYAVGLSQKMADPDLLKKPEFFGKFGRILKVAVGAAPAINSAQPAVHTAYITYARSEDALRAIHAVNNMMVEGRFLKASLGTTKYCSNFLKGQSCHKPECMYLHDVAENEISFTKDDMHAGKHTEYERRLHEQMAVAASRFQHSGVVPSPFHQQSSFSGGKELVAIQNVKGRSAAVKGAKSAENEKRKGGGSLENLSSDVKAHTQRGKRGGAKAAAAAAKSAAQQHQPTNQSNRGSSETRELLEMDKKRIANLVVGKSVSPPMMATEIATLVQEEQRMDSSSPTVTKTFSSASVDDLRQWNNSISYGTEFGHAIAEPYTPASQLMTPTPPAPPDRKAELLNGATSPVAKSGKNSKSNSNHTQQTELSRNDVNFHLLDDEDHDELDFDPFAESSRALEEIMEEEKKTSVTTDLNRQIQSNHADYHQQQQSSTNSATSKYFAGAGAIDSSMLSGLHQNVLQTHPPPPGLHHPAHTFSSANNGGGPPLSGQHNSLNDLRESFKAMLPNVNVHFTSDAVMTQEQPQHQQQLLGGFFSSNGIGGNSSTSSLPALHSSIHSGMDNSSRFCVGASHFRQQQPFDSYHHQHSIRPQHPFEQHSQQFRPFIEQNGFNGSVITSNGPFNGPPSASYSSKGGFPLHNQHLPISYSLFEGGVSTSNTHFQTADQQQQHHQHRSAASEAQQDWLPVPPGFSPRGDSGE